MSNNRPVIEIMFAILANEFYSDKFDFNSLVGEFGIMHTHILATSYIHS